MYTKTLTLVVFGLASGTTLFFNCPQDVSQPANQNSAIGDILSSSNRYFRQQDDSIEQAANAMRIAPNESERKAAEVELRKLLDTDYDARLDEYEKYLDELEAQLADMRTKLQRRRDAKAKMIDLRVKVLEAESDDLGWPARVSKNSFPTLIRDKDGKTTWSK